MRAQDALTILYRDYQHCFGLVPLDNQTRTKAQYFRTTNGKVFGIILGDMNGSSFSYTTTDLLLEPVCLPFFLAKNCEVIIKPYRGSSTEQPSKGVFLKHAQTRVRVESEAALRSLVAWYAGCTIGDEIPCISSNHAQVNWKQATTLHASPRLDQNPTTEKAPHPPQAPEQGLLIRSPWIEKILSGEKSWEMRSQPTRKRGWIALIKAGSSQIYGVARIVDSLGPLTDEEMMANRHLHGISQERLPEVQHYRHAWILADVQALPEPIAYKHPSGAVIFTNLDSLARFKLAEQL